MFTFAGATEEAQSLAPPNAHPWDEYFGSLDQHQLLMKVATAADADEPDAEPSSPSSFSYSSSSSSASKGIF